VHAPAQSDPPAESREWYHTAEGPWSKGTPCHTVGPDVNTLEGLKNPALRLRRTGNLRKECRASREKKSHQPLQVGGLKSYSLATTTSASRAHAQAGSDGKTGAHGGFNEVHIDGLCLVVKIFVDQKGDSVFFYDLVIILRLIQSHAQ